jgi:hypothetical protein
LAANKGSESKLEHLQNNWHSTQRRLVNHQAGAILVRQVEHEVPEFLTTSDKVFLCLLASIRQQQL